MSCQVETRPASPDDVPWLIELRRLTIAGYLEKSGLGYSESDHRGRVLYQFDSIQIVRCGNSDIGMMKVVRDTNIWELIQIQVLPAYQRKGIATHLIKDVLTAADQSSVGVKLSVLKTNPARALYERLGFCVTGENAHSFEMQTK